MKNLDFAKIRETVKNVYGAGTGTFKDCAAAAGLDYIPAGKSNLTKRATPTIEANGRAYDFHAFLKACNIDIVKHERLTAGGEKMPAQRYRTDKIKAAKEAFIKRITEVSQIKPTETLDLNTIFAIANKAAAELDKKEAADREKAMQAAKVERKRKAAAAKVEKASDEDKLYIAAAALGLSIEQVKAMQAQTKGAKVTK